LKTIIVAVYWLNSYDFRESYKQEVSMLENNSGNGGIFDAGRLFFGKIVFYLAFAPAAAVLVNGCSSLPCQAPKGDRSVRIQSYRDEASRLRGLSATREVAVERETSDALQKSLGNELEKPENRVFLNETELLLHQFRVLKPGDSLAPLYLKLMSQQVAAYYDPEKKRLVYVDENVATAGKKEGKKSSNLPEMERFVYVHEYCHALEDAHFDLDRLSRTSMCDLDRNLAMTSFMEGNAVLTGLDGLLDGSGVAVNTATPLNAWIVDLLGSVGLEDAAEKEFEGVPPMLAGALLRPYLDGAVFSNRIRRETGWQGIDAVYRSRIPLTTAEILYPERRYFKAFRPAVFEPEPQLFATARRGVAVNSLGALGTALWLGSDEMAVPAHFGFLKGWMGDRVYFLKGESNAVQTVWLSMWERPGMARAFSRRVERRLRESFGDVQSQVRRRECLVAAVWTSAADKDGAACAALSECALQTRVDVETPSALASWFCDLPWPVRFQAFDGVPSGCEMLGGYAADVREGAGAFKLSLASGLLVRVETNPDRSYFGTLAGLMRHVRDNRSDFTYWKLPVLASWHRRGTGDDERYRWSLLWGVLADGNERRARVLLVPVWRKK